ncbi:RICIN domain-containing protein [Longispora sp. K20-0274]|uniref:RICIN domain-containing protein n=1 Tax=Longispora sp. K20-0274 TaxID=3088255 RepID=UPI00399A8EE5
MKRVITIALTMAALALSAVVVNAAPASAGTNNFMIRNDATGLCLEGTYNLPSTTEDVRGALCDTNNKRQRWNFLAPDSVIEISMAADNGGNSGLCLHVDAYSDVFTTGCGSESPGSGVLSMLTSLETSTTISNGRNGCYIGMLGTGVTGCTPGQTEPGKKWDLTFHAGAGGPWTYANANSGKCIDMPNFASGNGVHADQWTCDGGSNQKWTQRVRGAGFEIVNLSSGKCLEMPNFNTTAGYPADQWTCDGGSNQLWFERFNTTTKMYSYANVYSGMCLELPNWNTTNGTAIDQWPCDGGTNQGWK